MYDTRSSTTICFGTLSFVLLGNNVAIYQFVTQKKNLNYNLIITEEPNKRKNRTFTVVKRHIDELQKLG